MSKLTLDQIKIVLAGPDTYCDEKDVMELVELGYMKYSHCDGGDHVYVATYKGIHECKGYRGYTNNYSSVVDEPYYDKRRGLWGIPVDGVAKRGDWLRANGVDYKIATIETYARLNPPLPWGFYIKTDNPPKIGDVVTFIDGPMHKNTKWPMSS